MADELEAIAPTIEQAPPAIETEQQTPPDEPEIILDPGETELEPDLSEPEIETMEIDWDDGKKYVIPKAIEAGILKNKDYTTKTQEVAERRKALDTRESEIEHRLQATDDELNDRAMLVGINAQLEQYRGVDWVQLWRTDPVAAGEHQARYQQLQQAAADTSASLNTKQTERTQRAQQDLAKRFEETTAFARKEIPGWKPELDNKLVEFAISEGVTQDFLRSNMSPTLYKFLHRAYIGHQTLQKQTAPKYAAQVAPLATVSGKSTPNARTDLASADMEAYVAARKRGVGGKASF